MENLNCGPHNLLVNISRDNHESSTHSCKFLFGVSARVFTHQINLSKFRVNFYLFSFYVPSPILVLPIN